MFDTHLHFYYALFVLKDTNFEKCFAITENAEITAVGLQTLKQTSIMSSERKKRREAEQRQIQHNLTHQTAKERQKNILDYYRLREQRCILKMIPPPL